MVEFAIFGIGTVGVNQIKSKEATRGLFLLIINS